MKWLKFLAVFVLMVLVVSLAPGVANAEKPDPKDPNFIRFQLEKFKSGSNATGVWNQLSAVEKEAVMNGLKGVDTEVIQSLQISESDDDTATEIGTGCKRLKTKVTQKNMIGGILWRYFQQIDWCYDGTRITSVDAFYWGEVYWAGWQNPRRWELVRSGGVNQWEFRLRSQAEFKLCLGSDVGCIQYFYPWIDQTVRGNGTSSRSKSW